MKKITLLFATLLAMSGDAFGQKEGKVLWENVVDAIPTDAKGYPPFSPVISPSGNILAQYYYLPNNLMQTGGIKLYDKNGKMLWNEKDFFKKPIYLLFANTQNKNYTLLNHYYFAPNPRGDGAYDSTVYLGKDFNFLRKFETQKPLSFLMPVDDGVFYYENEKSLVKYNSEGKEEWRYDSPYPILINNKKAPYIGSVLTNTKNQEVVVILDKNGKKLGTTEPQPYGIIYPANDKGFWLKNNVFEYKKFDSTGRQSANYLYKDGFYDNIAPTVLADNSILLSFVSNNEVLLTKISQSGDIKRFSIPANIKFKDYYNTFIFKVLDPENKIMYSLRLQDTEQAEADIKYKIGVVDFDNTANSWSKDIRGGASNGINGNAFTFEAGNTFFQVYPSPTNPPIKTFKVYNIKGDLTWESPFVSYGIKGTNYNIIGDYLYTQALYESSNQGFAKIRIADGKIFWSKLSSSSSGYFAIGNYQKDIQIDKNGNDVIMYTQRKSNDVIEPYSIKISSLNNDGTEKWIYKLANFPSTDFQNAFSFPQNVFFTPTDDGKLIVLSQETKDNKQQYILRKISPCEDLNAISITANKTEACPTEAIKLSIPKQDGVTYQWQKDGKDIPNFKDISFDFSESGTYTVVVKDEICQNTATSNAVKVNIRSLPTAQITAPKTTFCEGEKTTMAATTNGTFFQWQKDEKDILNATSGIYEVSQSGNYRVGVRDDKCPQVGYSNIYTINVKPTPQASINTDIKGVIYEPFTVKMTANSGTGLAYQWLKDDIAIPNETKANYEAKKSGKYNVSVTQDGCTKLSDALTISILIPLANSEEIGEEEVKVYPNPSKGEFKIILPKSLKSADVQLFDTFGREHSLVYVGEQAQVEGLVQGIYFLKVSKGEKTVTSKLIIE